MSFKTFHREGAAFGAARAFVFQSTLRTQEYIVKGDLDGKTLIDARRDGSTEGMQHFEGQLEKLWRAGTIDMETCMSFATNPGNLCLQVTDLLDPIDAQVAELAAEEAAEAEFVVERISAK